MTTDYTQVPIIQCSYQLALELHRLVVKFPRHLRYGLGERLTAGAHDFLDGVIAANFHRGHQQRTTRLQELSPVLLSLRITLRLAQDLRSVSLGEGALVMARLEDLSKQLAAWTRWSQGRGTSAVPSTPPGPTAP